MSDLQRMTSDIWQHFGSEPNATYTPLGRGHQHEFEFVRTEVETTGQDSTAGPHMSTYALVFCRGCGETQRNRVTGGGR